MTERTYTWTDAEPRERLAEIMRKAKVGDKITVTERAWRLAHLLRASTEFGIDGEPR